MKIINVSDPIIDVSDFTNNIPKHEAVIMVYMMEQCPHCIDLKPKWEAVKDKLSEDNDFSNVMVADIDSNVSSMLPLPPVSGFPNIKVLKDEKITQYEGEREVDPLLEFLKKTVTTPKHHTSIRKHTHHNYPKHRKSPHSVTRKHTHHNYPKHRKSPRSPTRKHKHHNYPKHRRSPHVSPPKSTARRSTARRSSSRRSSARRSSARK